MAPSLDRDVPVLIVRIGRYAPHHGTTGLIRSLGRLGVPVYAITRSGRLPGALSRYLTGSFAWPTTGLEDEADLVAGLRRIAGRIGRPAVAVANDDEASILLAEHRDAFADRLIAPPIAPGLPRALADKHELHELCLRHGIPTPRSVCPRSPGDLDEAVAAIGLPAVVKHRAPFNRLRAPVVPATTVLRTREDVEAVKRAMSGPGRATILVQEYLPSDPAAHDHPPDWFVHVYCDAESRALVRFTGVKLRAWPAGGGVTARGLALANPELAELSERFCRSIGYCGLGDLDWRFDARSGRFHLVDFNPRIGAQAQLFRTTAGVDGVRALHLDLTERPVPQGAQIDGVELRVEHLDLAAGLVTRVADRRTPVRAVDTRRETAWFARDDVFPFVVASTRFAGLAVARGFSTVAAGVRRGIDRVQGP
ncbi:D-aspartate ligase [Catenulispora sp. GP43]|uniref:carboxylate--amine ligase n=1 Tax=Catenulispora sp. GP43 TaxID=3156263 RepID=UPI003511E08A